MKAVITVLALAVSLMIVGNLSAAEEKGEHKDKHPNGAMSEPWRMLKGLNLTDDQKAKLEGLKKEYGPKLKDDRQSMESILTEDQKKVRDEVLKAAKAAGKKPGESWKEVKEAVKLTDEQKAKLAETRKSMKALHKEIREKIEALLTPEQKEMLKKSREERKEHKEKGK